MEVDPETVRMLKDGATGTAALVAAYVGSRGWTPGSASYEVPRTTNWLGGY